jgi:hypothetical protein
LLDKASKMQLKVLEYQLTNIFGLKDELDGLAEGFDHLKKENEDHYNHCHTVKQKIDTEPDLDK